MNIPRKLVTGKPHDNLSANFQLSALIWSQIERKAIPSLPNHSHWASESETVTNQEWPVLKKLIKTSFISKNSRGFF